jgi:HD-GYP domain-containing protein (c-di-GMP phosphodiesterase class II)
MLRVPVNNIQAGMVLARPLSLPLQGKPLHLPRGKPIPDDLIPRLGALGVKEVWIRHPKLEFLEGMFDEELAECQRGLCNQVKRSFEQIMRGALPAMELGQFRSSLQDLFSYLKNHPRDLHLLQKVSDYDSYLVRHSANVCYLAVVLGFHLRRYMARELGRDDRCDATHLQLLGVGCLLHDIGKTQIPPEILNKPTRLTREEMEIVKRHPVIGYEMIRGQVPALVADVVLNHHQRWNGEGYPERLDPRTGERLPALAGRRIPIFSRIATMVDVYDAATSHRCYSGAKHPVQVLHEMRTQCQGYFDPQVECGFYEIIPPFPIGQTVTLSDGTEAVVVDFNPEFPTRPKVQTMTHRRGQRLAQPSEQEIDLTKCPELEIIQVDDLDVRPFLASQVLPIEVSCEATLEPAVS